MKILFAAKPTSDQFTHAYTKALGCDRLITKDYDLVVEKSKDYDVLWLEWANDFTAEVIDRNPKCKVMVRVHDHEIYQGRIFFVDWDKVDYIWFINRQSQVDFNKRMSELEDVEMSAKQFFLPNAVDLSPFSENLTENKHIGFQSIIFRERKRIDRAIDIYRRVVQIDPEWQMTIRAEPVNPEDWDLIKKNRDLERLHWDMRRINEETYGEDKSDVDAFFQGKSVVLSTSNHEGFHYAIAEGMACGCMPVVWDWEWGFAGDFWKPFVYSNIEEMVTAILNYRPSNEYRKYVEKNFSGEILSKKLIKEL